MRSSPCQALLLAAALLTGLLAIGGCGGKTTGPRIPQRSPEPPPLEFVRANIASGGALYDRFWSVTGGPEPTLSHPLWSSRPDQTCDTLTGAKTWRCKECHGWDYRGVAGGYRSGIHRTGFPGMLGTTRSPREVFDLIKTDHAYGAVGLSDSLIWDLTKFVFEGVIDARSIIDSTGAFFTGDIRHGELLFNIGIGSGLACTSCHGFDGLTPPPGADPNVFIQYPGRVANLDPWEFQHRVRFGKAGKTMPSTATDGGTLQDVADVGAFVRTLPMAP
jgi:thiosulfate dehydrogenase